MAKAKGYSLWLMPDGDVYRRLLDIISQLSEKYNAPSFEPHVTLLGGLIGDIDVILGETKNLAALNPFKIKLTYVDYLDQYFRCLFIHAESPELIKANQMARKIFNKQPDPNFMPHLSLMYGNFSVEVKREIVQELGKFNISFDVKSIHLFSNYGEPKEWYRIEEFKLK